MIYVETLLTVGAVLLLVPTSLLLLQAIVAVLPFKLHPRSSSRRPSVAVLMPAHNEASVLTTTLQSIMPQLVEGDRLLLVADNCSDATAKIAHAAGTEVIERFDLELRGKGYALDFGIRHLQADPPEVVIVIDADCLASDGAIDSLARVCSEQQRPIQALYLMHASKNARLKQRIAEFAWLVKNYVRPLGYLRMGLPCQLMGAGMAFPWSVISNASLASGHIVEDLKLGIDLTRMGKPPLFYPEALVTSVFPDSEEGTQIQRTRWEHGHLDVIVREVPKLMLETVLRSNLQLFALALDISVPPLALLMLALVSMFGLGTILFILYGAMSTMMLAGVALLFFGSSILVVWWRFARGILNMKDLIYVPIYALCKIPLYMKFVIGKKIDWIRTTRD